MTDTFTPPTPLQTAVLFIVFNRPDTTAQVFEAIRKAKPPRLYVAADGPRAGREGEVEKVANVREIATAVDWPCEVKTLFQDKNIGCNFGPRAGIDWFFEYEEAGIILEDDCFPSQSFFWFCEAMLNKYQTNDRIMAVTGTNITRDIYFEYDYWFSNFALMWGWASWKRAWMKYDPDLTEWVAKRSKRKWLKEIGNDSWLFAKSWEEIFDRTIVLGSNATWWDYQWIYSCWINKGLTIAPRENLIRNIGYTSDATHTVGEHPILSNLVAREISFPLQHPTKIEVDKKADEFISRHWFGVSWNSYIKSLVLKFPGVSNLNKLRKALTYS